MTATALIVEDDENLGFGLRVLLAQRGWTVHLAPTATEAFARTAHDHFDAVILDLGLPDADGYDVLERLVEVAPRRPVIVLTGRDRASEAVRAMRVGAADYLTKPVEGADLAAALTRALVRFGGEPTEAETTSAFIGESPAIQRALAELDAAARSPRTPVLLTGESGVGKELAAHRIHAASLRGMEPFIAVNAACLPASLLESELFGHEAGAFTGARATRRGLVEQAHGGTLFLDEAGELPLELQPRFLRVVESRQFRRLGGDREITSDFRLVSATNRVLEHEVATSRFRRDLYHRICVMEVHLPPLRERASDIPALARWFLQRLATEECRNELRITTEALTLLEAYPWPGNVRELRNAIERAYVLCPGPEIGVALLPAEIRAFRRKANAPATAPHKTDGGDLTLAAAERRHILRVFESFERNLTRTAHALGITRVTLRTRLRTWGVAS